MLLASHSLLQGSHSLLQASHSSLQASHSLLQGAHSLLLGAHATSEGCSQEQVTKESTYHHLLFFSWPKPMTQLLPRPGRHGAHHLPPQEATQTKRRPKHFMQFRYVCDQAWSMHLWEPQSKLRDSSFRLQASPVTRVLLL